MSRIILRDWQKRCKGVFGEKLQTYLAKADSAPDLFTQPAGEMSPFRFRLEACVGSGKSLLMAQLFYDMLVGDFVEELALDFGIFVAPNTSICGWRSGADREAAGLIGALERRGIWAWDSITAESRMPGLMAAPQMRQTDAGIVGAALVCTYQYLQQPRVQETLLNWVNQGLRLGLWADETHHLPEGPTAWTKAFRGLAEKAYFLGSASATWFRTDRIQIYTQTEARPDFSYSYADGIQDGIVRPVSFWIPRAMAVLHTVQDGMMVDERPVRDYLEELPSEVGRELFNPEGAFVERMILQADAELLRRRAKYADAGCLVVCPPGFHGQEAGSKDEEDRAAKKIHARVQELTGRRAVLVLNGDPDSLLAEYRESNSEYLVAVNRVSEGCDIPRLRLCLLLRDLRSELLFMQIIGRIIRRRDGEDDQPALVIMAPLYHLVEWAREVTIAKAGAQPKACEPCPRCGRMPCKCPCKRCGQQRPCKCPCPDCGQRPCICPPDVDPEIFVEIHGEGEDHIIHGTDIEDQYALRAGKIRDQHAACRHQDKANIAYILQADEQTNGAPVRTAGADDQAARAAAVLTAANWTSLRDQVPVEVKRLAYKCFKGEKNPYQAAFRHVNQKFFYGEKWSQVREDPAKLPVAKLQEILTYLQRMTNKR